MFNPIGRGFECLRDCLPPDRDPAPPPIAQEQEEGDEAVLEEDEGK